MGFLSMDEDDRAFKESTSDRTAETFQDQSSAVVLDSLDDSCVQNQYNDTWAGEPRRVRFATIERRFYPVAPSDHPASTGEGPAIALDGWQFTTEASQWVNAYENQREPRVPYQDLRLSPKDRERRLKEHGATDLEMSAFALHITKAKQKRAETVEALKRHGDDHLVQEEKRENTKRWLQKFLGLRKTQDEEQVELWEQAQKALPQKKQRATSLMSSQKKLPRPPAMTRAKTA